MNSSHARWFAPLFRGTAAGLTVLALASLAPASAHARDCSDVPAALSHDIFSTEGFKVIETTKLYRRQDRPWDFIPTGASVLLRAPMGLSEADIHRVAACHANAQSPLAVPGARFRVQRSGDLYQLFITADKREAALEIQHRAGALR